LCRCVFGAWGKLRGKRGVGEYIRLEALMWFFGSSFCGKEEANKDDDNMAGQVSNGADKAGFSVEGKVAIVTGAGSG
jgi:hypothetical protein